MLIAVKTLNALQCRYEEGLVEQLFFEVKTSTGKYVIGVSYMRPSSGLDYYNSHLNMAKRLLNDHSTHQPILLGDFNLPHIQWVNDFYGVTNHTITDAAHLIGDTLVSMGLFQNITVLNENDYTP